MQVAGAEAAVALLVEQVGPSESAAGLGADDETDSDLGATVADSGKRRQQASAAKDHGRMQTLQDAAAGKAQPFGRKQQTVAGAKCNKRLCVAVEERPALPAWMANQGQLAHQTQILPKHMLFRKYVLQWPCTKPVFWTVVDSQRF